ncbi:hypothetical protein [Nostoc sp. C117]|uniref:hypothetical protein n=1 Tax=Nostoc sp. C117 TaxID=3349875 RepID=UPI00370D6B17
MTSCVRSRKFKLIADTNRDEIGRWMGGIGYYHNNLLVKEEVKGKGRTTYRINRLEICCI